MSNHILHHHTGQIPYQITKTNKRQRLTIKISVEGQLSAYAPLTMPDDEIQAFMTSKLTWIMRKLKELEKKRQNNFARSTLEYIEGEHHYFLGQQYPIKINIESNVMPAVELIDDVIHITMSKNNPKWIKILLQRFYQRQATIVFTNRLSELTAMTSWVSEIPTLSFRTMKSRWGSCSHDKKIRLNYHLIKVPMSCIDHVILHELCHLEIMDHSSRFYRLLTSVEPNWKKTKKMLDQFSHVLHD